MEFRVFPEPAVKAELEKYIRVRLYTDNGSEAENKNGQYALALLNNAVNPLYAVIDGDGKLLANTDYNIAKDVAKMTDWLKKAHG